MTETGAPGGSRSGDREPHGRGADVPARPRRSWRARTRVPTSTSAQTRTTSASGPRPRARPSSGASRSRRPSTWELPFARWFEDGTLNVAENCVDRHVAAGLGDKVAYHWIGEPGDTRTLTFADLHREVQKAANALLELGIGTGDRVAIYMPMIPELPIAMLACARIGAPHTVVFGGFSAEALSSRINDAEAQPGHHRRRRLATGQARGPEVGRGRGGRAEPERRARPRRAPPRRRRTRRR